MWESLQTKAALDPSQKGSPPEADSMPGLWEDILEEGAHEVPQALGPLCGPAKVSM